MQSNNNMYLSVEQQEEAKDRSKGRVEKGVDITFKVEISSSDDEVPGILNVRACVLHYSYLSYLHQMVRHVVVHIIKHLFPCWLQNFLCSCQ